MLFDGAIGAIGLVGAGSLVVLLGVNAFTGVDPIGNSFLLFLFTTKQSHSIGRTTALFRTFSVQEKKRQIEVDKMIEGYNDLHKDEKPLASADAEKRNSSYTTLVNSYYELATLFYEWGWGQCFHFAYQLKGETFSQSIARHEYFLAGRLGVRKDDHVLDVGCGIGGPMRNIARFTRAKITGVTLNEYQVLSLKMGVNK